ncbi:MAG: HPr kinase/phosphatase C-terminal domain-containing protein [Paracoccaceae bacterium]|nr:HPr kinase/phosphatase C-terminal domain-containing protein [Paracoccaceae bacterium]
MRTRRPNRWARASSWACRYERGVTGALPRSANRQAAPGGALTLHASCVAVGPHGLLILGRTGSGKSSLALSLMAHGAILVADDRTEVWEQGGTIRARAPAAIRGVIEARGIGILAADTVDEVALRAVIDLDETETERLPPHRTRRLFQHDLPLLHGPLTPTLPAALLQYLKGGRSA